MRRIALLATALLLQGCASSGVYQYLGNTFTLPGANPNLPSGSAETYEKVRALKAAPPGVMLTDTGDVWPGPPAPEPALADLEKRQSGEGTGAMSSGQGLQGLLPPAGDIGKMAPLPPLPDMPGFPVTPPPASANVPANAFARGVVPLPGRGGLPTGGGQSYGASGGGHGDILVPNGNGTSTVISPNGSVTTIPTPK